MAVIYDKMTCFHNILTVRVLLELSSEEMNFSKNLKNCNKPLTLLN